MNQRLVFLTIELGAVLSAREASLEGDRARRHHFWATPSALENFIDTLQAGLELPPSPTTARLASAEAEMRGKRAASKRNAAPAQEQTPSSSKDAPTKAKRVSATRRKSSKSSGEAG
jgi:hypothetical protein